MRKIVILEGLPGVGKTTIIKEIEGKYKNIHVVHEIINGEMPNYEQSNQFWFMENDDKKMESHHEGIIIIDRGPISTLSYNQTRVITDKNFDFNVKEIMAWFGKYIDLLNSMDVNVFYLSNNQENFSITLPIPTDPFGSEENQKLLEEITLYNCRKYVRNFTLREYHKNDLEKVINEIIDKSLCS